MRSHRDDKTLAEASGEVVRAFLRLVAAVGAELEAWALHEMQEHEYAHRPFTARLVLTTQGDPMPLVMTIDTAGEALVIEFLDRLGDVTAPPLGKDGGPAVVTYASSDTTVATVNPVTGAITPLKPGEFAASVTVNGSDGTPVLEPDGVTPFAPAPLIIDVGPGLAVSARLEVEP